MLIVIINIRDHINLSMILKSTGLTVLCSLDVEIDKMHIRCGYYCWSGECLIYVTDDFKIITAAAGKLLSTDSVSFSSHLFILCHEVLSDPSSDQISYCFWFGVETLISETSETCLS